MNNDSAVVVMKDLTKVYGDLTALDRLTLTLERGQILGSDRPQRGRQDDGDQDPGRVGSPHQRLGNHCRMRLRPSAQEDQTPGGLHAGHLRLVRQHASLGVSRLLWGGVRNPPVADASSASTKSWT